MDVTSKMAIAQSELKQLEAERKKLTHMEKVNMEKARDDIQLGHKLVAE